MSVRTALWHARGRLEAMSLGVVVGGLLAVAAAAGGWLLGSRDRAPLPTPGATSAALGPLRLTLEAGARRSPSTVAVVPGLHPSSRAAVYEPVPGLGAHAVLVFAAVDDASLVPSALRRAAYGQLPPPSRTTLAGLGGWEYTGLDLPPRQRMDVKVVPTTAGVLAVACVAPTSLWGPAYDCDDGVTHVELPRGVVALPPAPAAAVRMRLPGVVRMLDAARARARRSLADASQASGQERAARSLQAAYAAAGRELGALDDRSRPARAVVGALAAGRAAYGDLGAAAKAGDIAAYARARRSVARAESALRAGLAEFSPPR